MLRICWFRWLALLALVIGPRAAFAAGPEVVKPDDVKVAVTKALPLLKAGAEGHVELKTCFACHNQALSMLAFTTARKRGLATPEWDLSDQLDHISAFLDDNRDNYRQGKGQGGQVDTAGYALYTLELGGWTPDAVTEAVVEYLLQRDQESGHWRTTSNRPPSEVSPFTPTYLAIRALRKWGTDEQKPRIDKRIETARAWLLKAATKDTEDHVFRLKAMHAAGITANALQSAVDELLRSQRADGGWGQTDDMASDAYATGTVLVALHDEGGLSASDAAYQHGVAFLVKTQRADGTWLVHSRSKPFQTYYESGFPHGKDQFISMAASGWAATALALAVPHR